MAFSLLGSRQTRHPDFFRCEMDDFGGGGVIERTLIPADCVQAGNKFTPGGSVVSFKVGQNPWYEGEVANMVTADEGPYVLPWTGIDGTCMVTIDVAGPGNPKTIDMKPNDLRGMIGYVIDECVQLRGEGGYTTNGLTNIFQWFLHWEQNEDQSRVGVVGEGVMPLWLDRYPDWVSFLTVSVTSLTVGKFDMPGDFDPVMPRVISEALDRIGTERNDMDSTSYAVLMGNAHYFTSKAILMREGKWLGPWWKTNL